MSIFLQRLVRPSFKSQICLARNVHASTSKLKSAEQSNPGPNTKTDEKPESESNAKIQPLGPLDRPLGVRQRPTTVAKTRTERMKALLDQETRMAQRRHLIKEAGKGYFHDLNMTRKHGGKTWIAPSVLIREDKALYLPNVTGRNLEGVKKDTTTMCFGRVTILAMLGTQISEVHVQSFAAATVARYRDNSLFQFVQINLQENLLKSFLVKIFSNSFLASVPKELQSTYLISNQNLEYVRDPLGMTNSKVGYVYLIDENLKVRWGGCADATLKEAQGLESCTGVLLKRLGETLATKAGKRAPSVDHSRAPAPSDTAKVSS